ncbi:MAG: hypothetical protein J0M29_18730 [Chitinophagales bacterium]|nr:hypothetical protein [Saprospiraceae bacterium]MBN8680268.1 hypothetical protein [Chitinophagales bacterium]
MQRYSFIFLLFLTLNSCVKYHYNEEGGVRVNNSKVFKYNKERFRSMDKSQIDTNAIYILSEPHPMWDSFWFIRFFPTGQVLFIPCDTIPPGSGLINNKNKGIQGYYILKDSKIKIDMFQEINYGQTGKYFGRVESDGNILLFESRPETCFSIYPLVEKVTNKKNNSHWRKFPTDQLKHYKPDW